MKKLLLVFLLFTQILIAQFNPVQFYEYGSMPAGYTTEYTAILNRAIALGYTLPDATQNTKNDNKIRQLKSIGAWTKFDVFYNAKQPTGLADFATLNWINPLLFQMNQSNASLKPTFVPNSGFKGGSGKYFNTGFIPSTHSVKCLTGDGSMMWKAFDIPSTYSGNAEWIAGTRNGANKSTILIGSNAATNLKCRLYNDGDIIISHTLLNDSFIVNSFNSNSDFRIYENGVFLTSDVGIGTTAGKSTVQLIILGYNNNGTIVPTVEPIGFSYMALSSILTGLELDIYNIMNETY